MVYIPKRQKTKRLSSRIGQSPGVAAAPSGAHTLDAVGRVLDTLANKMAPAIMSYYAEEAKTKDNSAYNEWALKVAEAEAKHTREGSDIGEFTSDLSKLKEEALQSGWGKREDNTNKLKAQILLQKKETSFYNQNINNRYPKMVATQFENRLTEYKSTYKDLNIKTDAAAADRADAVLLLGFDEDMKGNLKLRLGRDPSAKELEEEYSRPETVRKFKMLEDLIRKQNMEEVKTQLSNDVDNKVLSLKRLGTVVEKFRGAYAENPKVDFFGSKEGSGLFYFRKMSALGVSNGDILQSLTSFYRKKSLSDSAVESKEISLETQKKKQVQSEFNTKVNNVLNGGNYGEKSGSGAFEDLKVFARENGLNFKVGSFEHHSSTSQRRKSKEHLWNLDKDVLSDYNKNPENYPTKKEELRLFLEDKFSKNHPSVDESGFDRTAGRILSRYSNITSRRRSQLNNFKSNISNVFARIKNQFGASKGSGRGSRRRGKGLFKDNKELENVRLRMINRANSLKDKLTDQDAPISDSEANSLVQKFYNEAVSGEFFSLAKKSLEGVYGKYDPFKPPISDPLQAFMKMDHENLELLQDSNLISDLRKTLLGLAKEEPEHKKNIMFAYQILQTLEKSSYGVGSIAGSVTLGTEKKNQQKEPKAFSVNKPWK